MGDGRPRSPSLWDDISPPSFQPSSPFVARNVNFNREEVIDSRLIKREDPSIGYHHYRSEYAVAAPRSRRPRVVHVRKFPLSVIVKRQCAVAPLGPPSLHPTTAASGVWSPAKVVLRISESDGDQHVETDAWAFHEHDSPLSRDMLEDERHPHLMESSEDPSLFSPDDDFGDHEHWPWIKEERDETDPADIPEAPEDLQCPIDDLEPMGPMGPMGPLQQLQHVQPVEQTEVEQQEETHCYDTDSLVPMKEVVERSLVIHGEELAGPPSSIMTGFPCPEKNCQSVLSSLTALRKHKLVHAPKIYACSMCDRAFAERTKLNRHERSHTGEKPYKCPVAGCSKVFAHNFNLNSHLKLHNDERPFVCGVCGRSFAKNSNLRVHSATHSRPKPTTRKRRNF